MHPSPIFFIYAWNLNAIAATAKLSFEKKLTSKFHSLAAMQLVSMQLVSANLYNTFITLNQITFK